MPKPSSIGRVFCTRPRIDTEHNESPPEEARNQRNTSTYDAHSFVYEYGEDGFATWMDGFGDSLLAGTLRI
ncbi:hypothetical protein [Halohasta salina]|uniref:hypothetical protein n=1 Tax=Halohasta salina TaxID=2961621 RepID=UPI0020A47539|nr:hypothetical protein [Halohasta salina]